MIRNHDAPNIVIIHTHDTGRYFHCYGYDVKTPNIDALASQGMRFDNYFCPAPQCSPSRASALTGLYPHNNGMIGLAHLGWQLKPRLATLPKELNNVGYETALFGVQHEAKDGRDLGYSTTIATKMPQRAAHVARVFADYLKVRGANKTGRPFFASVGFWETHRPFDEPVYTPDSPASVSIIPPLPDTPQVRQDLAEFHGTLTAADHGVGTIMDALRDSGLADNTLVIFTTDHGIAFPRAKGTLYDSGIGIALIVRWPGRVPAGTVSSALLCNVDLMPTLLDAARAPIPAGIDGKSFLDVLLGQSEPSPRDSFFCELTWHDRYSPVRGMRTDRWKYIRHFEPGPEIYLPLDIHRSLSGQSVGESYYAKDHATEELYDLETDPLELRNLALDPAHVETLARKRVQVQEWMSRTSDPLLKGRVDGIEAPEWEEERRAGAF